MSHATVSTFTSLVGVHRPSHKINKHQILEQSWCGQSIMPIGDNQSLSKSSIHPFKIKSRPNQVQRDFSLLMSLHSFQDSLLIFLELPTSRRGFKPTNLCHHKNTLVWIQVLLSRHWSQLMFSSTYLSSLTLVVAVVSGQHSHFINWL